eukprot:511649_1
MSKTTKLINGLGLPVYAKPNLEDKVDETFSEQFGVDEGVNQANVIEISATSVYVIGGIIALLLLINIFCLCYTQHYSKQRQNKYAKVSQIASSDDDMQNLKEYPL